MIEDRRKKITETARVKCIRYSKRPSVCSPKGIYNVYQLIHCKKSWRKTPPAWPDDAHCKKELVVFPSLAGMSLIKLFLGGNNLVFSRPERVWSVTSRLGTGKWLTLFYSAVLKYQGDGTLFRHADQVNPTSSDDEDVIFRGHWHSAEFSGNFPSTFRQFSINFPTNENEKRHQRGSNLNPPGLHSSTLPLRHSNLLVTYNV